MVSDLLRQRDCLHWGPMSGRTQRDAPAAHPRVVMPYVKTQLPGLRLGGSVPLDPQTCPSPVHSTPPVALALPLTPSAPG